MIRRIDTGIDDINGRRVFTGDKVRMHYQQFEFGHHNQDKEIVGTVQWINRGDHIVFGVCDTKYFVGMKYPQTGGDLQHKRRLTRWYRMCRY